MDYFMLALNTGTYFMIYLVVFLFLVYAYLGYLTVILLNNKNGDAFLTFFEKIKVFLFWPFFRFILLDF